MDAERFEQIAIHKCLLEREKPILVGVSGGADSLCLTELLLRSGFRVIIAHFDHQLRSTSGRDAGQVEHFARERNLGFLPGTCNVKEYCEKFSFSIEEGARNARYDFLFKSARETGAQAVAVGHNADDQAETILMHFLRGAGAAGLKGMQFRSTLKQFEPRIPLVRPLLETPKSETEKFCAENGIEFVRDESNADLSFFRNKLRLELLPLLDSYQPGMRKRLAKTAVLMSELDDFLDDFIAAAMQRVVINDGSDYQVLSLPLLRGEKPAVQRALIRRVIQNLRRKERDVDFDCVERVMEMVQAPGLPKWVEILEGLEATIRGESLTIKDHLVEIIGPDQLWIPAGSQMVIRETSGIVAIGNCKFEYSDQRVAGETVHDFADRNPFICRLDLDKLRFPLLVRTRQAGDRVRPFGMGGHTMKLADFWINNGLPRQARENWPLVCDQDGICWIPGFRIMHPYRVSAETKCILEMKATRR